MKNVSRNQKIIAACYGLSAINCIAIWMSKQLLDIPADTSILFFALILALMVLVSLADSRKGMCGSFAVACSIIMHFLLSILLSVLFSCLWILVPSHIQTIILSMLAFIKK